MATLLTVGNRVINLERVTKVFLTTDGGKLKLLFDVQDGDSPGAEEFDGAEAAALRWWFTHNSIDVLLAQAEAKQDVERFEQAVDQIHMIEQHEAEELARREAEDFAGGTAP